jgi:hypothetical protein
MLPLSRVKPRILRASAPKAPAHRARIARAVAARWADPEYRRTQSVARAARRASPETRARLSAAAKARWAAAREAGAIRFGLGLRGFGSVIPADPQAHPPTG